MRRHRVSLRFWLYTLLVVAGLALFPLYTHYKQAAAPIPPGVYLDGLDLSALKDTAQIRAQMEPLYREPIGVRFEDRMLVLKPEEVDFAPDIGATVADAGRYLEGVDFVDIAVREAIGLPQQRRDVALRYQVNEEKLRAWLVQAAAGLDYAPLAPRVRVPAALLAQAAVVAGTPVTATGSLGAPVEASITATAPLSGTAAPAVISQLEWIPGVPGHHVDVEASIPLVVGALASHDQRMADLALTTIAPPVPTMADLGEQLPRVLDTFPVYTAVYVKDLQSGEEAQADGDAAFSGMDTLKLALAVALMEALPNGVAANDAEAQQVGQWLDAAIGQGDDGAADEALAWLGGGDVGAGAQRVTALVQRLGLENTYLQSGFGATTPLPKVLTPSNQREKPNTQPDPNLQTTPQEIGRLLAAVFECSQGQGILLAAPPPPNPGGSITPEECATILFYFTHNELRDFLWRGLPDYETQWVLHQQGLAFLQHGDVGLVWGPAGPYVISVYYYNPGLTSSDVSNRAAIDLSRMVWEFFAFRRAQGAPTGGDPPVLAPPPGYLSIDKYAPSVANPSGE